MPNHDKNVRRGYTLLEILVAVTLMMLIMLGVSQLFSSVGKTVNNTQATLGMISNLRGTKIRLEKDLSMLTIDPMKKPPVATGTNSGYLCIIEGMGANHENAFLKTQDSASGFISTADIAKTVDSEDLNYDNTVGDMDDVIMFTARAPEGEAFRGLCGSRQNIIESNTAEVIWFCRGNTLYRRVLLIIPKEQLQNSFPAYDSNGTSPYQRMTQGRGFYNNYDVSIHFEPDSTGKPFAVANTLEDLRIRQYRFAHSFGFDSGTFNYSELQNRFPFNIHRNAACYYLRMPTLTETSHPKWDASKSFEWNLANASRTDPETITSTTNPDLRHKDGGYASSLPGGAGAPFIDYWDKEFPWASLVSGNTEISSIDRDEAVVEALKGVRIAEDVILTNVISFDVQVWDEVVNQFINLGNGRYASSGTGNNIVTTWTINDGTPLESATSLLGTQGLYLLAKTVDAQQRKTFAQKATGNNLDNSTPLPCVYDTWAEEYERDGYSWPNQNGTNSSATGTNQFDNNNSGVIDDLSEWTTPPPYPVPLRGIKITIRTFDPTSRSVREMTVVRDFSKGNE